MAPRTSRPLILTMTTLIILGVLFWAPSFGIGPLYDRDPYDRDPYDRDPYSLHVVSLAARLRKEETRYAATLKAREGLIKKYGPSKEKIQAYPTHNELYTIWNFFIPAFQCPHRVQRVGTLADGGKWLCGLDRVAKQDNCVIYSFGINDESSFESTLLKRAPGCEVWGYDYSVNSWGPEITSDPELRERAHFKPFALGGTNNHNDNDNPKYWTLDSLMELNGHTFIDILKIDIEGGEFDALTTFLSAHAEGDVLPVGQLQLEIHARDGHENFEYFSRWWATLEAAGLRPFWTEPNLVYINIVRGVRPELAEYSFMNIRGNHALVNEAFN
jgi:hypothetical protein